MGVDKQGGASGAKFAAARLGLGALAVATAVLAVLDYASLAFSGLALLVAAVGWLAVEALRDARFIRGEARRRDRRDFVNAVSEATREQTAEVAALISLLPTVSPRALLPAAAWSMNPRSLAHLADLIRAAKPKTVLELGSGASSVWVAYLLEAHAGRLVTIDHLEEYADATRASVERHGHAGRVEVRHAPLAPLGGDGPPWYDAEAFADVGDIELLIVDGPPQQVAEYAREPALDVLVERLAPGAIVVADDIDRPAEREMVERWLARHPRLERFDDGVSRLGVFRLGGA